MATVWASGDVRRTLPDPAGGVSKVMDIAAEAELIVRDVRACAPHPVDPAPIIRTSLRFHGAKVGDLRRVAASWRRTHPAAAPAEIGKIADDLWMRAVREEMVVAVLLHGADRPVRSVFGTDRLDRWRVLLDNWETTDQLGMGLVGPWVGDDPRARLTVLDRLAGADDPWSRRLSLVAVARLGRVPDAPDLWAAAARLVLRLASDREAAMPKAMSWVLREHLRWSGPSVAAFVTEHERLLPAVAVRETRRKLATGTKR